MLRYMRKSTALRVAVVGAVVLIILWFLQYLRYPCARNVPEFFTDSTVRADDTPASPVTAPDSLRRYFIEIFKEPDFRNRLTYLKDAPEQHNSAQINYPIRSLRIRVIPNDTFRFTQEFSVFIYLKSDPTYKIQFKVPRNAGVIDYKIPDTLNSTELLDWMTRYEPKVIAFSVGEYYPIDDLFDESFMKQQLAVTPMPQTDQVLYDKNDDSVSVLYPDNYLWVNPEPPLF